MVNCFLNQLKMTKMQTTLFSYVLCKLTLAPFRLPADLFNSLQVDK